jgi:Holin of 3TMs, for gene-transfer release
MNPLDLISGLTPIISKVLDLIPDPNAKQHAQLELQAKLMEYAAQQGAEQAAIDTAEAGSSSLFVAGWRPAIGWVCAAAFAWNWMVYPIVEWALTVAGVHNMPLKPVMDGNLMELTLGMLGLGAMRSFDKLKGVAK